MAQWVKEQPDSNRQNLVKVEGELWLTKLFSDFPQTRCDIPYHPPPHTCTSKYKCDILQFLSAIFFDNFRHVNDNY